MLSPVLFCVIMHGRELFFELKLHGDVCNLNMLSCILLKLVYMTYFYFVSSNRVILHPGTINLQPL